jgi:hypothetical protein
MELLNLLATFNASDWGLWEWITTIVSAITFIPVILFIGVGTIYKTVKSFIKNFIKKK